MTGQWITDKQVVIYMKSRKEGHTQPLSAAKAGISGREIEYGRRLPPALKVRNHRTRKDPFEAVWSPDILPLLKLNPNMQSTLILEELQQKHGYNVYPDKLARTLQRRVKNWRHTEGPEQEIIFRQNHAPGNMGLSDFTQLKGVTITIRGESFEHLLYHFRLSYSGWSYMQPVIGGESYAALADGLQNALWLLGGTPKEHRTDSLSAAFKNESVDTKEDFTQQYEALCKHFSMQASRNNRGKGHENGSVESPHGHLKIRIKQMLIIRGSDDFDSIEAYQTWLNEVVAQHNRRNVKRLDIEKEALSSLPSHKTANYRVLPAVVSSSSTIRVSTSLYSVPSRLKGATLQVHQYHDHLRCYLGSTLVIELPRIFGEGKKRRAKRIDYRHLIVSLVKKPGAFYNYQHRDALLPNTIYQNIWSQLDKNQDSKTASKIMVGLLNIAAKYDCEQALGEQVLEQVLRGFLPEVNLLEKQFGYIEPILPSSSDVNQHALPCYDQLIPEPQEVSHAAC